MNFLRCSPRLIVLIIFSFSLKVVKGDSLLLKPDSATSEKKDTVQKVQSGFEHTLHVKNPESSKVSVQQIIQQYRYFQITFPSPVVQYAVGNIQRETERRARLADEDWQFFVLIFLLMLLAVVRYSYAKEWDEIKQVLRNWFPARPVRRELSAGISLGTILLTLFALLALPFYLFALVHQSNINFNQPDWMVAIFLAAGVAAVIMFRYVLLEIASWLLPDGKNVKAYNLSEMQINRTWSVFLFPFIPLILFLPDPFNTYFWWVSLVVCAFFVLLRIFRGMSYGGSAAMSNFFHFLLYICSLEIAPIFILIRLLEHMTRNGLNF